MTKEYKKISGYTLTEAAIVLGIVGIILSSIWLAASSVYENNALRNASESIVKIAQNIRMIYLERSSFTSGNGTNLTNMFINSGAFPTDSLDESGNPITPWKTPIRIIVISPTSFEIILDPTLPKNLCMKLASMMVGPGREPSLLAVSLDGTPVTPSDLNKVRITDLSECSRASYTFSLK